MADNNFEDIDEMLTKEIDMSKGYTLDEILACLYEAATKAFNHDLISPTELVGVRIAHEILASMPPDVNFLGEDSIVKTNVGVDLTMDPPSIEEAQKMLTVAHSVLDLPAVPPGLEEIAEKVIKACSEYLEDSCEELAPPPPERSRAPESPLEDFKSASSFISKNLLGCLYRAQTYSL